MTHHTTAWAVSVRQGQGPWIRLLMKKQNLLMCTIKTCRDLMRYAILPRSFMMCFYDVHIAILPSLALSCRTLPPCLAIAQLHSQSLPSHLCRTPQPDSLRHISILSLQQSNSLTRIDSLELTIASLLKSMDSFDANNNNCSGSAAN